MNKATAFMVLCLATLMLVSCSKKSEETGNNPKETGIPTKTASEAAISEAPAVSITPADSKEMTKEEEDDLFNQIISSIPLKAKVPVTYKFSNVSVHDPSIVEANGTYYIFGSHLAVAKTTDLMNWTLVDSGVKKNNKVIPDAMNEMSDAFTWAQTNTFWAPDVIQLEDGKYYYYYCNCEGSKPLAALGVAVSDNIEGPYKDIGVILKSGQNANTPDENGDVYDATIEPNVVDPCVFYDKEGKLWMMYGSYSGGIYILELDKKTGMPLEKGYGKKLLGKNHLRIEGSFIQYSEETGYYYMFLSFGGLAANGGYHIRVARSENPDGPYYDAQGNDMINCKGADGSFFDDNAADDYGTKLMGNFHWNTIDGEDFSLASGYVSPGHNSTLYDENSGKYFLIFHTRFEGRGENHEVRVHQMFLNENGWFVVAPYRYVGETIGTYTEGEIAGAYKVINHQLDISAKVKKSENVILREDHTVVGDWHGTWELKGDNSCILTVDGVEYKGVFLKQWDEVNLKNVMTFTVQSLEGKSIWGSGYEALE
ncbi:MAG TPA: glycoside hydrolase family 43 protein [Mobilitalea sp.]|nr:glycoside hydrolase family 43 protein [Mobilitalea sp.]